MRCFAIQSWMAEADDESAPAELDAEAAPLASTIPERDPLDLFAEAAGYADHELWWEHQIERHEDPTGLFDAIREAMTLDRDAARRRAVEHFDVEVMVDRYEQTYRWLAGVRDAA